MKLWRSGIFYSAVNFITLMGHFLFNIVMGRFLAKSEYGYMESTLALMGFLILPISIVSQTLIHHMAHFRGANDEARLQGLLNGSRRFLLRLTIAGSLFTVVMAQPLCSFFNFPRATLMFMALAYALLQLWTTFATTLSQGMAWFKRLAIIGLITVVLRILLGWAAVREVANAETAVLATAAASLSTLVLLYWWKDLFQKGEETSPWNLEFLKYLLVSASCLTGSYFFLTGDLLIAQRYFVGDELGNYAAAGRFARNLPAAVGPLLIVVFTSRSGQKNAQSAKDQQILLALYAVGLTLGAICLVLLKNQVIRLLFGQFTPESAAMINPFTLSMVFIGLSQAIGIWSLASRWTFIAVLYGGLGVCYWLALLFLGKTPEMLLKTMPIGAFTAFVVMVITWWAKLRKASVPQPQ